MVAHTPTYGLPYPDDYQQPADSPNALEDLATATDAALAGLDTKNADQSDLVNGLATKAAVDHTHYYAAQLIPATTLTTDGQITAYAFPVPGTLAPGAEYLIGPFGIVPGTYCVCTVQHPSTYLYAVYNDRGDGSAEIKVRNTTASTPHSNIKVHAIFMNLPT